MLPLTCKLHNDMTGELVGIVVKSSCPKPEQQRGSLPFSGRKRRGTAWTFPSKKTYLNKFSFFSPHNFYSPLTKNIASRDAFASAIFFFFLINSSLLGFVGFCLYWILQCFSHGSTVQCNQLQTIPLKAEKPMVLHWIPLSAFLISPTPWAESS